MTQQILVALQTLLESDDVAVTIDATHYCVKSRGVMDATSVTTTTALGGFLNLTLRRVRNSYTVCANSLS